jgi:hypothetical protein
MIMGGNDHRVTDGLVLLVAWAEFMLLLALLAFFVLHRDGSG